MLAISYILSGLTLVRSASTFSSIASISFEYYSLTAGFVAATLRLFEITVVRSLLRIVA